MADIDDDGFNDETFKGFGEDPAPVTPPVVDDPATPPVVPPVVDPPKEEPKEDPLKPAEPPKKDEEVTPPVDPAKKPEEDAEPPKTPETPPAPEEPAKPLTRDDVSSVISDLLNKERTSGKELETTSKEVLDSYYPEGLSNILIDEKSGKKLETPADVVAASGDSMSTEEAAQWLMNEQYKLDQSVTKIKEDARTIAETTVNFKRDSLTALQKYAPLFEKYPHLQAKVWDKLLKQVKTDKEHGVILSAPDVIEHYDDYLEPYQQAYEFSTKQPATNPTPPVTPEPPKPSTEDRMDEHGDGSQSAPNDPTDFAQQVAKELNKGI